MQPLAKIIADSVSPHHVRLTTLEVRIPRVVLAEFNTHRVFSRNSASSRAIPVEKLLDRAISEVYIPERWTKNGKGMQGHGFLEGDAAQHCTQEWLLARDNAVKQARKLLDLGVHKQQVNRLLEPFLWHTIIVTSTEWGNWANLRNHPAADPAIQKTAAAMVEVLAKPTLLQEGEWHLPFIFDTDADLSLEERIKVSIARCARVSYLTHDGKRDVSADLDLYDRLLSGGHMSPFEHVARPMTVTDVAERLAQDFGAVTVGGPEDPTRFFSGNFRGWVQYRKTIVGESDILAYRNEG